MLGEWKLGIIGLLASKLCEKHTRPAVVCSDDAGGGLYVGSARSVPATDISRGISACADHLVTYGDIPRRRGSPKAASFEAFRLSSLSTLTATSSGGFASRTRHRHRACTWRFDIATIERSLRWSLWQWK